MGVPSAESWAPLPRRLPDRVRVLPGRLTGVVTVPGDKSLSHRALLLAGLATGPVEVRGLAPSEDVRATIDALRRLGAKVEIAAEPAGGLGGTVRGPLREPEDVLDCGNSGTALRLLAGVAAGIDGLSVLSGDDSLRGRPVDRVAQPLARMGAYITARAGGRLPPLVVRGGRLTPIRYESPVASAQVKSAVLLAALATDGPSEVLSPLPSRDHTERLLRYLGVEVAEEELPDGRERVTIVPGPLSPLPIRVLRDPSSAAFWMVAAAPQSSDAEGGVALPGLCVNPTRLGAVAVLRAMGADIRVEEHGLVAGEPCGTVRVAPAPLGGAKVAGAGVVAAIDELPVLAIAASCSRGGLEVRDAAELRVKESDRIRGVVTMLGALGVSVEERRDGFRIPGGQRLAGGVVDAGGDHRIAMAACVAGTLAANPVEVRGFCAVASSYPAFLEDLRALGGLAEPLQDAGGGAGYSAASFDRRSVPPPEAAP
ncbi:MAG: 3-phosphoshikimate 1-carboxyvinyltransferase [Actinomycetota bacterium]|nr:3-phosphoshikimate 1-carboxyvinyltransferase [Actinomycetota bacterium]